MPRNRLLSLQALDDGMNGRIAAIIPTYNEVDLLSACVRSLQAQNYPSLEIYVVNAGDPLEVDLGIHELSVPSDYFWTSCIDFGVKAALKDKPDYLLFTNADTTFLDHSLEKLVAAAAGKDKTIACSPAYLQLGDTPVNLLYSHQSDLGPLLYGKLTKAWQGPNDAPEEPFTVDLTGGQGVLIPAALFDKAEMDVKNFPHYASDHDLWLQARRLGYRLLLVPKAGIVNKRDFNESKRRNFGSLLKALRKRMASEYTPESWVIMWRLRRKHQGPFIGFFTTLASFGLRWTVGLPKIIRRS
jgi:GT2 family glycosyltransferase